MAVEVIESLDSGQAALVCSLEQSHHMLNSHWNQLSKGAVSEQTVELLLRESNAMASLAASHKLDNLIEFTKDLEARARSIRSKGRLDSADRRGIVHDLENVKAHIFVLKPNNIITLYPEKDASTGAALSLDQIVNIGILERDEETASTLKYQLQSQGYHVYHYVDHEAIKRDLAARKFEIVIVDLLLPNCPLASALSVEEFLSNNPIDVPIIMLSEDCDLSTRLIALRAGIKAYLTKPINEEELFGKIKSIIDNHSELKTRVLVVDDDPMLTEYYEAALGEEGFAVKVINDPLAVLEEIDNFKPDVVTLDYMMPGCNGLEIAEILRGDPRYMKIPIVFMSASDEAMERQGLMGIFGNSFLMKPVDVDELTSTLKEVAAKAKKISDNIAKISKRKSHEHLENRDYFLSNLETKLANDTFSGISDNNRYLCLCSVDNMSALGVGSDEHAAANAIDEVESFFAEHPLIKGRGCRYKDEGFLLQLEEGNDEEAKVLFRSFCLSFAAKSFSDTDPAIKLTISAGSLALDDTAPSSLNEVLHLLENANLAAYNAGGNRTCVVQRDVVAPVSNDKILLALKAKSYQLAFQSIVKPDSDEHIFEVLLRLQAEDGEIYTPERFLPLLKDQVEDGLFLLDRWVIENAYRALENAKGRDADDFSIVIKLMPDLKHIERLLPFIYNIKSNTRLRGVNRIYFSIHEKALLSDLELSRTIVDAFKTAGCGFMYEHCTASAQSLSAIDVLSGIDFVKLDPEIGKQLAGNPLTKKQIRAVQGALEGGDLIAGLVEDAQTFANYWDLDVRYFQGFFVHRPNAVMQHMPLQAEDLVLER